MAKLAMILCRHTVVECCCSSIKISYDTKGGGGGGEGHDANFSMKFEPSFSMSYKYICHCLQVQVCLSATFAMMLRGEGEEVQDLTS